MSMQTITVNGIKISYNSNVKKKSTESNIPLADDGLSLMIQATEAYVESGYQIKALEAIGAFSTEAAPGFVKKIGGGIKAVIEKIKEFFIKIGQYIKRVFLGASIKTQAKAIYSKLTIGISKNWKNAKVAGCGNISFGLEGIKNARTLLNQLTQMAKDDRPGKEIKDTTNKFATEFDKLGKKYLDSVSSNETTVGKVVNDPNKEIVEQLKGLSDSKSELFTGLVELSKFADLNSRVCDNAIKKLNSINNGEDTIGQEMINKYRTLQQCTNDCSKMYTGVCRSIISIGKAIIAKPGEEIIRVTKVGPGSQGNVSENASDGGGEERNAPTTQKDSQYYKTWHMEQVKKDIAEEKFYNVSKLLANSIIVDHGFGLFSELWKECEKSNIADKVFQPLQEGGVSGGYSDFYDIDRVDRDKTDFDYWKRLITGLEHNFAKERLEKLKQLYPKIKNQLKK